MTFRAWLDRTFWPGRDAPKQPCLRAADVIASLSPERQAKIEARTGALLAEIRRVDRARSLRVSLC